MFGLGTFRKWITVYSCLDIHIKHQGLYTGIPVGKPDEMGMRKPAEQWRIKQKTNQSHRMPYTILYLIRPCNNTKSIFILIAMYNRSISVLLSPPKAQADAVRRTVPLHPLCSHKNSLMWVSSHC